MNKIANHVRSTYMYLINECWNEYTCMHSSFVTHIVHGMICVHACPTYYIIHDFMVNR